MKCPRCGFISFDNLAKCKKCGFALRYEAQPIDAERSFEDNDKPERFQQKRDNGVAGRPPDFDKTIQSIKRELEAIEGEPVGRSDNLQEQNMYSNQQLNKASLSYSKSYTIEGDMTTRGGFFIRMIAYYLDSMILSIVSMLLLIVSSVYFNRVSFLYEQSELIEHLRFALMLYSITNTVIEIFYFTYCHAVTGQTIGKWVCGLKVVGYDGNLIGFKRSFLRWVGYFISRFFLYLGFLWVAFDKNKQGWHDKIARSYVIRV